MPRKIDSVYIDIGAKTGKLQSAISQANNGFNLLARAINPVTLAVGTLAGSFGVLVNKTLDAAEQMDEIQKRAILLDASAESVQRLSAAFGFAGVSVEKMTNGLRYFNRITGEAIQGNKSAIKAFESLGLSIQDIAGKDLETRLQMVMSALSGVANEQQRMAIGAKLFAAEGQQLVTIAEDYADAMTRASSIPVFSQEDVDLAAELSDNWAELKMRINHVFTPSLIKMIELVNFGLEKMNEILDQNARAVASNADTQGASIEQLRKKWDELNEVMTNPNISSEMKAALIERQRLIAEQIYKLEEQERIQAKAAEAAKKQAEAIRDQTQSQKEFNKLLDTYKKQLTNLEKLEQDRAKLLQHKKSTTDQKTLKSIDDALAENTRRLHQEKMKIMEAERQKQLKIIEEEKQKRQEAFAEWESQMDEMMRKKKAYQDEIDDLMEQYSPSYRKDKDRNRLQEDYNTIANDTTLPEEQRIEALKNIAEELRKLDSVSNKVFASMIGHAEGFGRALGESIAQNNNNWEDYARKVIADLITMKLIEMYGPYGALMGGFVQGILNRRDSQYSKPSTNITVNNNTPANVNVDARINSDGVEEYIIEVVDKNLQPGERLANTLGI